MNQGFKKLIVLLFIPVFLLSCKQEIVDFFEAIQDYGYRSLQALGPKKIPVNENLLGGYVYQDLPVIISKKDETTYQIKFLSVLLYKEDAVVEAHATQLGTSTFLNLAMGDYYCFMRVNLIMGQELQIELLKDALKEYVPQDKIKGWLEQHPGETTYTYDKENDYSMDIYFSFVFEKVTIQEALRIQENRLRMERKELFENCSDYSEYEELVKLYPNDEFINLAVLSLYENCKTIEAYKAFIAYFPKSDLVDDAEEQIQYIIETERLAEYMAIDQKAFEQTLKTNTIDAYESFKATANTNAYRDSATVHIGLLASKITRDEVEWKWTNGESEKAFALLFYKIDYLKDISEASWIVDILTLYTLKYNQPEMSRKTLHYFDVLVELKIRGDNFLNLYLGKGFILWSLNEIEPAVKTFELKLYDIYDADGSTFKEHIKTSYAYYIDQGITFPDQKNTWKRIKKLKPENE
ncbi:MAG: hypothetical protein HYZ14_06350 [Bacteroidetes bacterium]|nr:hypothetical protein [Bacteroidota bacterium]